MWLVRARRLKEKYRRIRVGNKAFASRLGNKAGGLDALRAFGFAPRPAADPGTLHMDLKDTAPVKAVLVQLQQVQPSCARNVHATLHAPHSLGVCARKANPMATSLTVSDCPCATDGVRMTLSTTERLVWQYGVAIGGMPPIPHY